MTDLDKIIITEITDIVSVYSPKGRFETIRNRKNYGISFCNEGQITYTHNGKEFISDPTHAILLPKGATYTIQGNIAGVFPVINFECMNFPSETFMLLPIKNTTSLFLNFEQMSHNSLFCKNNAKTMSLLYNIIHALSFSEKSTSYILRPAIKYLEENFSSPNLTNKLLAEKCGFTNPYHFSRLFKAKTGMTPTEYMVQNKITTI